MTDQVTRFSRIIYDEDVPREKPTRCPECGSKQLELNLLPLDDEIDWETAEACGITFTNASIDALSRFSYINVLAQCTECRHAWDYGHRWYFSEKTHWYSKRFRPLLPDERKQIKATQQARAGQLPLPFDGGATR